MPSSCCVSGLVGVHFGPFWGCLGAKLSPFGVHFCSFWVSRDPSGPVPGRFGTHVGPLWATKGTREARRWAPTPPGCHFGPFGVPFWATLGVHFSTFLDPFLGQNSGLLSWPSLAPLGVRFWARLGAILGQNLVQRGSRKRSPKGTLSRALFWIIFD